MRLHPEEPEAGPWEALSHAALARRVRAALPAGERWLILVDGRSGGGKTTFASRLAGLLGAAVVHTDDIAWCLDPMDWAGVLADGVLSPWRSGGAVAFRPPGWVANDRPGAVVVPPTPILVVEGVGAGRASLAAEAALVVWVQSDRDEARRRGLERDEQLGRTRVEALAFWDDWMRAEEPFFATDRPWRRADLVVNGTPSGADRAHTLLARGPLAS
jgi:energy-coupling factor transporter ATP-binding protein EcfA2